MYRDSVNNKPVNSVLCSCALAFLKTDIDNFLSSVFGCFFWKRQMEEFIPPNSRPTLAKF